MKNPLRKRLPRELRGELSKYIIIFLFLTGVIGIVSGLFVCSDSFAQNILDNRIESNVEHGNFDVDESMSEAAVQALNEIGVTCYEDFFIEKSTTDFVSTLRIFKQRDIVNIECILEGTAPIGENEIGIDRVYAKNNKLSVGDTLTVDGIKMKISALIALPEYNTQYALPSDPMFDAVVFGVALVSDECFEGMQESSNMRYRYAWRYMTSPADEKEASQKADELLAVLIQNCSVSEFQPAYSNNAINYAYDDLTNDKILFIVFMCITIVIFAFIFSITIANTITREASVIGTLRATGYTRGELLRHYISLPIIVTMLSAAAGNILGYTFFTDFLSTAYLSSYSLPSFDIHFNADAFILSTVFPLAIMLVINYVIISCKLSLPPIKFLRRDLKKRQKKKAFMLKTTIPIQKRFKIRVLFQNLPNYITIFIGIIFATFIMLFGIMIEPVLDNYAELVTENIIASNQYILKTAVETENETAEKFCASSLYTIEGELKSEGVTIYGISDGSQYINADISDGVYISTAFKEKFGIKIGDTVKLEEKYGEREYEFKIKGEYECASSLALFMSKQAFCEAFKMPDGYFNGYFSQTEITDIDEGLIASTLTENDVTKLSRQMTSSMGSMLVLFSVFGIVMYMLIIFILSKIIVEKNTQTISMVKILGYSNREITLLYVIPTAIVVIASLIISIPLCTELLIVLFTMVFKSYSGWIPIIIDYGELIKTLLIGTIAYTVIAVLQYYQVRKIPLADALKNVE